MTKKYRRTNVDLNDNQIIEFQHSKIAKSEVSNRKKDYGLVIKKINGLFCK